MASIAIAGWPHVSVVHHLHVGILLFDDTAFVNRWVVEGVNRGMPVGVLRGMHLHWSLEHWLVHSMHVIVVLTRLDRDCLHGRLRDVVGSHLVGRAFLGEENGTRVFIGSLMLPFASYFVMEFGCVWREEALKGEVGWSVFGIVWLLMLHV